MPTPTAFARARTRPAGGGGGPPERPPAGRARARARRGGLRRSSRTAIASGRRTCRTTLLAGLRHMLCSPPDRGPDAGDVRPWRRGGGPTAFEGTASHTAAKALGCASSPSSRPRRRSSGSSRGRRATRRTSGSGCGASRHRHDRRRPTPTRWPMRFPKWHALGNAYLLVEREIPLPRSCPDEVRRLCDPNYGIGADGILRSRTSGEPRPTSPSGTRTGRAPRSRQRGEDRRGPGSRGGAGSPSPACLGERARPRLCQRRRGTVDLGLADVGAPEPIEVGGERLCVGRSRSATRTLPSARAGAR